MKLKSILAISLIILVTISFVACGKDNDTDFDADTDAPDFEETDRNNIFNIIDNKPETTIDTEPETARPETSADTEPETVRPETTVDTEPETVRPETTVDTEPETVDTWELVQKAEAEYYTNLVNATYTIEYSCADAETAGNLIIKVWHNSIWQISDEKTDKYTMENGVFFEDFNDALYKLEDDPDFIELCDKISSDQYEVIALMRKLKEPPKKYEDAYDSLKDFYNDYIKFTDLILINSESYNSFTEKFEEYDSSTYYLYKQMLIYFD